MVFVYFTQRSCMNINFIFYIYKLRSYWWKFLSLPPPHTHTDPHGDSPSLWVQRCITHCWNNPSLIERTPRCTCDCRTTVKLTDWHSVANPLNLLFKFHSRRGGIWNRCWERLETWQLSVDRLGLCFSPVIRFICSRTGIKMIYCYILVLVRVLVTQRGVNMKLESISVTPVTLDAFAWVK